MTLCFFDKKYEMQIRRVHIFILSTELRCHTDNHVYSFNCFKKNIEHCKKYRLYNDVVLMIYKQDDINDITLAYIHNSRLGITNDSISYLINPEQFHVIKRLELKNV